MATLKYSRQREAIKNYLMDRTDHPTADMVYTAIREVYPNISLGTVYRNLGALCDEGVIGAISVSGMPDRFEKCINDHGHIVCEKCGKIMDIPTPIAQIKSDIENELGVEITSCSLNAEYICESCKTV